MLCSKVISRADSPLRENLVGLIAEIGPETIPAPEAIDDLQASFLKLGVVPPSTPEDAAHVAAAFVADCSVLVSWNFKHITNVRRADRFNAAASLLGYRAALRIVTPAEVLYADEG